MNATTIATPGPFVHPTVGTRVRQATTWVLVGVAGTVLVGAAGLFWVNSQDAQEVAATPQVATGSVDDVLAHGGAGRALTGSTPIGVTGVSSAVTRTSPDLDAHGGGGTVWTVSGTQLK